MSDSVLLINENGEYLLYLVNSINEDLKHTSYFNLNTFVFRLLDHMHYDSNTSKDIVKDLLLAESIKKLIEVSPYFRDAVNEKDGFNALFFIHAYMDKLFTYYTDVMNTKQNKFDDLVISINEGRNNPTFIEENDLEFSFEEVQKTIHLLNEAVRNYYEIYFKKRLITTFSNDEIIEFRIKESELSHLLGVKLTKIVNNQIYRQLFQITDYEQEAINDYTKDLCGDAAISVLHKIVDIICSDKDRLLDLEYDRLRKMNKEYKYKTDEKRTEQQKFVEYSKINVKSKAFLQFKPFEELSLSLKLPRGMELIEGRKRKVESGQVEPADYSLLLSKNGLSKNYKYTSFVSNYQFSTDRRYFESLLLKTPEEISSLCDISSAAVSSIVELDGDDGTPYCKKEFTQLEQLKFTSELLNDFKSLDLKDLYYSILENKSRTRS